MTADIDTERYDRNIRVFGVDGQQALADTHVAVVGCGGLGSLMAEQLVRVGIGMLTLIDPDIVEESNLPRLYGASPDDTGLPKVAVLQHHLGRIVPDAYMAGVMQEVEDVPRSLDRADLVVAGPDQVSTRLWLNQYAVHNDLPYIDAGVTITTDDGTVDAMRGCVQRIIPGSTGCYECLDRGDREQAHLERMSEEEREEALDRGYIEETDLSPAPAVAPLNGIIASHAVDTAVRYITNYAEPIDYRYIDTITGQHEAASTAPRDDCTVCHSGDHEGLDLDTSL